MEEDDKKRVKDICCCQKAFFFSLNRILVTVVSQWIHIALFWLLMAVNYILLYSALDLKIKERKGRSVGELNREDIFFGVTYAFLALETIFLLYCVLRWFVEEFGEEKEVTEHFSLELRTRIKCANLTMVATIIVSVLFPFLAIFYAILMSISTANFYLKYATVLISMEIIYSIYMVYYFSAAIDPYYSRIHEFRKNIYEARRQDQARVQNQLRDMETDNMPGIESPPDYSVVVREEKETAPPTYSQLKL